MVTYRFDVGGIDREAVAEEVVGSAARVLMLAGFSSDQVVNLFRQAGDQIESGEAISADDEDVADQNTQGFDVTDRYDLVEKFDALPAVKALNRLAKRSEIIDTSDSDEALSKAISLALEAVKLRVEALLWLHTEATNIGLEVQNSRESWIEKATDEELDDEDQVVFLDDYQFSGNFNWHLISQIVRTLSETGSTDMLSSFGEIVLNDSLALDEQIRDDVTQAIATCEKYEDFLQYVNGHSGQGELAQSDFLDTFVHISAFEGGTHILQNWLDGMAQTGAVERFKRSNRWRVTVA